MDSGIYDVIPGLREAEERYKSEQLEAFLGIEPSICGGIDVLPLTPRMFIDLDFTQNAFFASGKDVSEIDIAMFLWRISPVFERSNTALRDDYIAGLSLVLEDYNHTRVATEIFEYVRRAWSGMPQFKHSGSRSSSPATWTSCMVHMMAKNYGWSEDYTLNMPYRRLWQYVNRILEDADPKYKERCAEADELRGKWLASVNTGAN